MKLKGGCQGVENPGLTVNGYRAKASSAWSSAGMGFTVFYPRFSPSAAALGEEEERAKNPINLGAGIAKG